MNPIAKRFCLLQSLTAMMAMTLSGCGPSTGAGVTGKVTLKGTPLTSGIVFFIYGDGSRNDARIMADGTFSMTNVKPGDVRIAIDSPKPNPPRGKTPGATEADPAKWFPIDAKYANPDTSGKTASIKGNEVINIELE